MPRPISNFDNHGSFSQQASADCNCNTILPKYRIFFQYGACLSSFYLYLRAAYIFLANYMKQKECKCCKKEENNRDCLDETCIFLGTCDEIENQCLNKFQSFLLNPLVILTIAIPSLFIFANLAKHYFSNSFLAFLDAIPFFFGLIQLLFDICKLFCCLYSCCCRRKDESKESYYDTENIDDKISRPNQNDDNASANNTAIQTGSIDQA